MRDSIGYNNTDNWESVDGVVVPRQQENLIPVSMTQEHAAVSSKPRVWQVADVRADSIAKAKEDSVIIARNDSLARVRSEFGIVLEDPYYIKQNGTDMPLKDVNITDGGMSWILALLALLFCLVCFKSRNNPRYFRQLFRDLRESRLRHNMFDNTVRESSFMVILNITWVVCAGILLWEGVDLYLRIQSGVVPHSSQMTGMLICIGMASAYKLFMQLAYWMTGNVFSDSRITKEWIKGANSATALESLGLFPLALVALCYPGGSDVAIVIGAILFGIGKLMFIYKGIRIFFSQIASLLLFLYYFCSLEIIPLILMFAGTVRIIRMF